MNGRWAMFAGPLLAALAGGPGCAAPFGLEVRECTAEELEFIDAGIAAAESVADRVGDQLALRYPDEQVTYEEILEQLRDARDEGRIRCADPTARVDDGRDLGGITGYADMGRRRIVLATGNADWQAAFAAFQAAEVEPPMDDQTLAKRLTGADREAFDDLRREARDRLLAPATPAALLAHEAGHLATGDRYPHTLADACESMDDPDFVVRAGTLTHDALYWQLWIPEARRIDGEYFGPPE